MRLIASGSISKWRARLAEFDLVVAAIGLGAVM